MFSCTRTTTTNTAIKSLDIFSHQVSKIDYDSISIVRLESERNILLGDQLKMKLNHGEIFIADLGVQHCIFRFDSNGKFICKIGTEGKGPQEYLNLIDFIIHGDTIDILSGMGANSMVTGYLTDGNFLYSKTIKLIATSFEKLKSKYIFYTGYNKKFHKFRMYITSEDGKTEKTFLPNKTELNLPVFENNFFKTDSLIYIKESFNNQVYSLSEKGLTEIYLLDFDKYAIPTVFFDNSLIKGFEMLNKHGFANIKSFYATNDLSIFEITVQKQKQETLIYDVVYDKGSECLYHRSFSENDNYYFANLVSVTSNNELVYSVYPSFFIKRKKDFESLPIVNPQIINDIQEMDNPILFFCKIKKK